MSYRTRFLLIARLFIAALPFSSWESAFHSSGRSTVRLLYIEPVLSSSGCRRNRRCSRIWIRPHPSRGLNQQPEGISVYRGPDRCSSPAFLQIDAGWISSTYRPFLRVAHHMAINAPGRLSLTFLVPCRDYDKLDGASALTFIAVSWGEALEMHFP